MDKTLEEEYHEFIVSRCTSVINSCVNLSQLRYAGTYCELFRNVYYTDIWPDIWNVYKIKFNELK
jgi:hypothetical protein